METRMHFTSLFIIFFSDLAQNKYFDKPGFNNFLVYLRYWKKPEYSKFLRYPICLAFLDIITEDSEISRTFRTEIAKAEFQDFVHGQVFNHWQHSKAARMRDMEDIPFCSNMVGSVFQGSERATEGARFLHPRTDIADAQSPLSPWSLRVRLPLCDSKFIRLGELELGLIGGSEIRCSDFLI